LNYVKVSLAELNEKIEDLDESVGSMINGLKNWISGVIG
jgi:CheY-specific phosphatase CheX